VRGVGLIHSADEIRQTLIASNQGAPVVIGDVAKVSIGNLPRLGIAGYDGVNDIVQGIVLMRRGAESVPTIKRVEAEVDLINKSGILPPGVSIQRIYDRSDLINITTHTVLHNMVAGIVLIFLLQWAFLGNLRSAIIVATTIPFALSFAIGFMVLRGESANLLSVGAIDFGLVVDATVIMVENIFRHLAEARPERVSRPDGHRVARGRRGQSIDLLRRGDHHRGLRAAVHAVGDRRTHIRADGEDLCVRHRRRFDCDVPDRAGLESAVVSPGRLGAGDLGRTRLEESL
jgi:Cu/Ag efflux pump CusA